jgi:hypothetical protein
MDFDFTKFGGRKADIPEPSQEVIVQMYKEMDELVKSIASDFVQLPENPTPNQLVESLNQLTMSESYGPMLDGMTEIYSRACSNCPNVDELKQLPPRIRALFFQWFTKELRPEISAVDTRNAPILRIANNG